MISYIQSKTHRDGGLFVSRLLSFMSARHGVVFALLTAACSSAFVHPGCPGSLAGQGWSSGGNQACARAVRSIPLRMSDHTEDRCVARAHALRRRLWRRTLVLCVSG